MGGRTRHGMNLEQWGSHSLAFQMANVGSEVDRTFRARERGKDARFASAKERCLALFFHTLEANLGSPDDARRVLRALERYLELVDRPDSSGEAVLMRYFLAWGLDYAREAGM